MSFLVERFLEMLSAERGAAQNTIESYQRDLAHYGSFLSRKGRNLQEADSQDLAAYLVFLDQEGFADRSILRHLSALRQFYRFLVSEGEIVRDPSATIKRSSTARSLPLTLCEEEVEKLLVFAREQAFGKEGSVSKCLGAMRLYCLLELAYATGLRVSELVSLPRNCVSAETQMFVVRGKGGKERVVPLNQIARETIQEYLKLLERSGKNPKGGKGYLFPSNGKQGHWTRQSFLRDLKRLAAKVGIPPERISPHVIRHAFASHLLARGSDLRCIQQALGHADISTTQIYTHICDGKLEQVVHLHHPLSGKSKRKRGKRASEGRILPLDS